MNNIITFKTNKRSYGIVKTIKGRYSKPIFFTASPEKDLDDWEKNTLKKFTNKIFFDIESKIIKDYKKTFWVIKERIKFWKDFVELYSVLDESPGLNYSRKYKMNSSDVETQYFLYEVFYNKKFRDEVKKYFEERNIEYLIFKPYPGNYEMIIGIDKEDRKELPAIIGKSINDMKFDVKNFE